jgi:D-glycerate 3-kinase
MPDALCSADVHDTLARWIARRSVARSGTFVLGISGAQGTGKSTLAGVLARALADGHGARSATLSLDDLYLTRAERARLARDVHPLLATRGVPGTHDVALGQQVIASLRAARDGEHVRIPRFDKAVDDRSPPEAWPVAVGAIDVLIFEGWCLGATPEPEAALGLPINELEAAEDVDGRWRRYVNAQLSAVYPALFSSIDALVFLAAPDMHSSHSWRIQQERELAAHAGRTDAVMSDAEVARFVQHYERISRHMLAAAPLLAEAVIELDRDHRYASVTFGR